MKHLKANKMKNIHILPTDKSSRITILKRTGKLLYDVEPFIHDEYDVITNQNIYITSDEEIKEGDYVCASGGFRFVKTLNNDKARTFKDNGIVSKQNPSSNCHLSNYKKIILTTDQDLIKDGVQAIDDEFLEWFVKNPSCEEVEVDKGYRGVNLFKYKIIISKEEPEQEMPIINGSYGCIIETNKQETIEKAALNYAHNYFDMHETNNYKALKQGFIEGAKYQAERMYSEEEVLIILDKFLTSMIKGEKTGLLKQWFEQFKKK